MLVIPADNRILYFRRDREVFAFLSHFHPASILLDGDTDHAKFTQHRNLAELLLATGDAELIEDPPSDAYWRIGRDGQGLNWAGRVLMEIRQGLRTDQQPCAVNVKESGGI